MYQQDFPLFLFPVLLYAGPDFSLLPVELLFPQDVVIQDKSVLSFTPALCASMQAALCVKYLTGRAAQHGTVYYFDLLNQEFETIPLV